jgi:hypothetical protein
VAVHQLAAGLGILKGFMRITQQVRARNNVGYYLVPMFLSLQCVVHSNELLAHGHTTCPWPNNFRRQQLTTQDGKMDVACQPAGLVPTISQLEHAIICATHISQVVHFAWLQHTEHIALPSLRLHSCSALSASSGRYVSKRFVQYIRFLQEPASFRLLDDVKQICNYDAGITADVQLFQPAKDSRLCSSHPTKTVVSISVTPVAPLVEYYA